MTNIRITEHPEQATAAVRERVPMAELTEFFARAFRDTMTAMRAQGVQPAGPPFGKYYGRPNTMVDVEAGFPVSSPVAPAGKVLPGLLPGGRVLEAVHIGPYDTMEITYSAMERYVAAEKLTPGDVMWESYLAGPETVPDPAQWETLICWPIN